MDALDVKCWLFSEFGDLRLGVYRSESMGAFVVDIVGEPMDVLWFDNESKAALLARLKPIVERQVTVKVDGAFLKVPPSRDHLTDALRYLRAGPDGVTRSAFARRKREAIAQVNHELNAHAETRGQYIRRKLAALMEPRSNISKLRDVPGVTPTLTIYCEGDDW